MDKNKLLLEQWKMASEQHRHLDNIAWQGLNYFIVTNGVLLTALGIIVSSDAFDKTNFIIKVMTLVIPIAGVIVSAIWGLIQLRQKWYQHYRADQAKLTEKALSIDGEQVLTLYKEDLNEQMLRPLPKWYRKTRLSKLGTHTLMVTLAVILTLGWFFLGIILAVSLNKCFV